MTKSGNSTRKSGELLHAKHAFPPNNLGYCGPDVQGRILDYLHDHSSGENLHAVLTKFESAYPFVKMIAKSTGRKPFDYEVSEAYWLGNSLLHQVAPTEFFRFTHQYLAPSRKLVGKDDALPMEGTKYLFRKIGKIAKPHHTFYVLGLYARSSAKSGTEDKILQLMDSCRISWGKVVEVKKDSLLVERPPLFLDNERLSLARPQKKEIKYDPEIRPFEDIRKGDWVSIHWNFASEKIAPHQLRNLKRFTALDIEATNRLVTSKNAGDAANHK